MRGIAIGDTVRFRGDIIKVIGTSGRLLILDGGIGVGPEYLEPPEVKIDDRIHSYYISPNCWDIWISN